MSGKLLFDQNVSRRAVSQIATRFPGRLHVSDVALDGASDGEIGISRGKVRDGTAKIPFRSGKTAVQPVIARFGASGEKGRMVTSFRVMLTKLDAGIACQSPPSRSNGSETTQRPRPLRKGAV